MNKNSKIYVAGHLGMVGSAIVAKLKERGYQNIIGRTLEDVDLTNQQAVINFFTAEKPEYVILAAAKVGGILANDTYRAQFIYENLMIQNNIIHQSYVHGVKKLLFLGSSCIYPKSCPQPIREEYLLTGELEQTNEPYAIAKIAGIKMCENYFRQYGCNFISVMPTNLYGPNDNYNLETSHVLPAIIRKMHLGKCLENLNWVALRKDLDKRPIESIDGKATESAILDILKKYGIHYTGSRAIPNEAKPVPVSLTLWGTGNVYREFMHVNDMATACVKIVEDVDITDIYSNQPDKHNLILNEQVIKPSNITFLNIGTGIDQTIKQLSTHIKIIVGFQGEIAFDASKADGTYKKLLDISRLKSQGFSPFYTLDEGIKQVYNSYVNDL